jgi:hypothetical protein
MMARDFKRAASGDDGNIPARDRNKCAAHGCPMPGTIATSIYGSNTWFCRNHFDAKYGFESSHVIHSQKKYES